MDRGTETKDTLLPASSLWVVVSSGSRSDCFELDGEYRRAIVVGSCIDADIRITGGLLAPVECFLVREGDEIRLVPACASSEVRIGSVSVVQPIRLWRKTTVEVGGIEFEVRIREEPPTAPAHEPPTQCVPSRLERASEACSGHGPGSNLTESAPASNLGQGSDEGGVLVRRIVPLGTIGDGATEAVATPQRPAVANRSEMASGRDRQRDRLAVRLSDVSVDNAALRDASGERAPPIGPANGCAESPPCSTAPAMISVRALSLAPAMGLKRLGLLTQRRPAFVALTGSIGAAAVAVALHWGASALDVGRQPTEHAHLGAAALLSPVRPFCAASGAVCRQDGSPRGAVCGCLPFALSAPRDSWVGQALRYDVANAPQGVVPTPSAPIQVVPIARKE